MVLNTQGSDSLKDNIITVLGVNTFNCLEPVAVCISESCKVDGFVSKSGQGNGRNSGDRQYFFVNGRPVDMPRVNKLVNELYRSANSKQFPIAILSFTVPTRAYDVNVTPDKRKIFFSEETSILQALREGLQQIYSPSNVSYSVNEIMPPAEKEDSAELCSSQMKSAIVVKPSSLEGSLVQEEHYYTECNIGSISGDEDNTDCNSDSISHDEPKEKHVTDSKSASMSVNDDQSPHDEEGLICENAGSFMGQEFTLRAHGTLKGDKSGKQSSSIGRVMRNQATLVSRTVESGDSFDKYSSNHSRHVQSTLNKFVVANKRKRDDTITALSEAPVLRNQASRCQSNTANTETNDLIKRSSLRFDQINETAKPGEIEFLQELNPDRISHKNEKSVSSRGDSTDREPKMVCSIYSQAIQRFV